MLEQLLKLIGCDKRWMIVYIPGFKPKVYHVQHYLGKPTLGWELFDAIGSLSGPFKTEVDAETFLSENTHETNQFEN